MKRLQIAESLSLPIEAVTEKLAFLGRTGTGKTYAAMKVAELMLEAGAQIVALDFVGKWYGLRVPGAGAPFPVPVFGGLQGDYPLEATGGQLVADLIVDRNISAVIDVSQFTRAEQIRFSLAFATQFFQRKKAAPSAVHLFLEECQEVLPQNPQPNEGAMLGAFERVWKLGRNFGIGGSLISQRPQEVNKKALNMSGTLFVFQMTGPQERKAIEAWVTAQDINEDIGEVLPTLAKGTPHVWSVAFDDPISATVKIAQKRTADVSATLKVDQARRKEKPLTPIDAQDLAAAMAETVERAKADDPRELRRQLAEARRDLEQARKGAPAAAVKASQALTDADRALIQKLTDEISRRGGYIREEFKRAIDVLEDRFRALKIELEKHQTEEYGEFLRLFKSSRANRLLEKLEGLTLTPPVQRVRITREGAAPGLLGETTRGLEDSPGPDVWARANPGLAKVNGFGPARQGKYRAMLIAMAQAGRPLTDGQVAARAGMALSGTFDKYLGQQRSSGYLEGPRTALTLTAAGLAALGHFDPLPTGEDLQRYWLDYVGQGKKRQMLEVLIATYPRALSDSELAHIAVMAMSGTFDKYLGQLRTLQLVTGSRKELRASEELFS